MICNTYGVLLSLYSLAMVSIPPPRATATKQDSFPTSNPTTDIAATKDLFSRPRSEKFTQLRRRVVPLDQIEIHVARLHEGTEPVAAVSH